MGADHMSAPDDPEARIRDLEQRVGDTGTEQFPGGAFGTPPPLSWPPDGSPAPPAAGSDRRWLSSLQLWLGLLLIVGAAAAYVLFGRDSTPATPPGAVSPGGPTTGTARPVPTTPGERQRGTVPVIPSPPTVRSFEPTAPPAGSALSISGIDENRTVTCDGNTVQVSGIRNTVVITGHCAVLDVSGIENVVTVDSTDRIEASGIANRVTFHSGTPEVVASGDNTVEPG